MFHIGIATRHPPLPEPGQLSETGIEFIELCLTIDPSNRPTASELFYHPWLVPMFQQMVSDFQRYQLIHLRTDTLPCAQTEHAEDNATPGGPGTSASSTLVDPMDQNAVYAEQLAALVKPDASSETLSVDGGEGLASLPGSVAGSDSPSL